MRFHLEMDDEEVQRQFSALQSRAQNTGQLMRVFAQYGENFTRERFATETAPDGTKWKDSRRKQEKGGKTLTAEGHLGDSVGSNYSNDSAEFGVGMNYASIHQFGGKITPKNSSALHFKTPGGGYVTAQSVTIPARPFLPKSISEMDFIVDAITDYLI